MTDPGNRPEPRQSRRVPVVFLLFLLVAILGLGLLFYKDKDLGDCYDKYERWNWRAEKCS